MLAGAFCVLLVAGCGGSEEQGVRQGPGEYADQLTVATNHARSDLDLPSLDASDCLERAARERAAELVGEQLEHRPLVAVTERCAAGGRVAENLVETSRDPAAVVDAWLGSSGHRNNLVDPALREIGTACVATQQGVLCSQLSAAPASG
jgi:uncharacterized protein YkwD